MSSTSSDSNMPQWIRNNIPDFQRAMFVTIINKKSKRFCPCPPLPRPNKGMPLVPSPFTQEYAPASLRIADIILIVNKLGALQ